MRFLTRCYSLLPVVVSDEDDGLMINNNNTDNNHDNNASNNAEGDFVDVQVKNMINGIRLFLNPQHGNTVPEEEAAAAIKINPATEKYAEVKIKILEESPRDADKLKEILHVKQKEYEKAEDSEEIEQLVAEIDMLKFVLFLVCRTS